MKKNELKEIAFLLQFEGDEYIVKSNLGMERISYYDNPIGDIRQTGLFGLIDALIDLGLTGKEIIDFYIHGHVEPYNDPYGFTQGIIEIVHGMSKEEIKRKYGYYLSKDRIDKLPSPNKNTRMLLSFCYDKNDTYLFIPNKDDLYNHFSSNYGNRYDNWEDFNDQDNKHQKIDGELFRAVRFLVRQGYDFPEIEKLIDEQTRDIILSKTNGKHAFILNKEYARKISNSILSFVCFLKRNNYDILNPENLFNPDCNDINIIDYRKNIVTFSCSNMESDVNKYTSILEGLNNLDFYIPDIISLCDKRIENIELIYVDRENVDHSLNIKKELLFSISADWLRIIQKAYYQGLTFADGNNLFDSNQVNLKVIDPSGQEQTVLREQFSSMLDIIIECRKANFNINFSQLFNQNQINVELYDMQGNRATIKRNQITHMMTTFMLLSQNGYSFAEYDNLFDETQPYIVTYDKNNQERIISRKQVNKIIRIQEISDKKKEDLTDSEKDLLSMLTNYNIRKKLFEWLPYTSKKWLPSSAIINKIPAEKSHEYFYNHNHERLQILKEMYKPKDYDEMEGIVSLGYILGLFDSKESTSEKAMNYIINYFLKKGVTADELHTTYGAIDLRKGYNKKFADFFMQHYSIDSGSFIEPDLGTNMTGELFERFNEVLESRPEKRIKTRTIRKLLTPIEAMASITNIEIDREMLGEKANDTRYIRLVELLMKFGASKDELQWAIELYEQALAIDEQKVTIPNIEDLKSSLMKFTSCLKSDPQAFVSGRKTNCCSRYGGYAQDRLTHVITDPDWRYVTFTSPNRTFFDGLVWYDKESKVVCIDNVEGQFSKIDKSNPKSIAMMADTVIRYADGIYLKMKELNIPCIKVNVGKDPGTASWEIFNYASQQKLINEDKKPCNYPTRNGITTDAQRQFTITDDKVLSLRRH